MQKIKFVKPVKIGDTSGKLTVIEKHRRQLRCRCECGGEKTVVASAFRRGNVKSCGCLLYRDRLAPGTRFGLLTVEHSYHGITRCRCDCGTPMVKIRTHDLRNRHTRSCGCLRKHRRLLKTIWEQYCMCGGDCVPNQPAVCTQWKGRYSFSWFEEWALKTGWTPGKHLVRIDQARGFEPGNCSWI